MKKVLSTLLLPALTATLMAGAGPGPWSDGAYYPGGLNGKYMGIVTGNNIAGVLGFALSDGAPPFRTTEQQSASGDLVGTVAVNTDIRADVLQNYFSIFVEGRTYNGLTIAGINIDNNTVAGALQGTDPPSNLAPVAGAPGPANFNTGLILSNVTVGSIDQSGVFQQPDGTFVSLITNTILITNIEREFEPPVFNNALSILARGLSGGFTAKIKKKQSVFTFKGSGELSTPANQQSYTASGYVQSRLGGDSPPGVQTGSLTNMTVSGSYQTHSTPFNVSGIRTSLFANNPTAAADAAAASSAGAFGGGGN